MNDAWHAAHVLGIGDREARLQWHLAHRKECDCLRMPKDLQDEAKRRGML